MKCFVCNGEIASEEDYRVKKGNNGKKKYYHMNCDPKIREHPENQFLMDRRVI